MFTITELQVLAALAEGRTVSQIGDRLGLCHSSVSKALRVAQQRCRLQLAERHGRRLRLTGAGADLARAAQGAVQEIRNVARMAAQLREGTQGTVRLLASPTPADFTLPPVLSEFLQVSPRARVILHVATMPEMGELLRGGDYDIAVGPPTRLPPGWLAEPLYEDELTFFVSSRSDLAARPIVTWDDLRTRLIVGHFVEPFWGRLWTQLMRRPFDPEHVVELRGPGAIVRLAEMSDGVGMLPRSAIVQEVADGRLVPLHLADFAAPIPYELLCRIIAQSLPLVQQFRAMLIERLGTKTPASPTG